MDGDVLRKGTRGTFSNGDAWKAGWRLSEEGSRRCLEREVRKWRETSGRSDG